MIKIDIKLVSIINYFVLTAIITLVFLMTDLAFLHETQAGVNEPSIQKETEINWPRFRGPNGLGISYYTNIPASWNGKSGEGILWKKEIPLPGENSPILWGDRVFVTGADREKREVYCFDANSGNLLWQKTLDNISSDSDYRNVSGSSVLTASTSAADGERIFTIFANGDIFCHDLDGNHIWSKCIGPIINDFGHASSLLVYQDLLIVQLDQAFDKDGLSKILALRTNNGDMVWNTKRDLPYSWATPIVIDTGKRDEMITCGNPWVIAYAPLTGKKLWRVNCLGGEVTLSPVYSNGLVIVANGMAACAAIRPGGEGDVTDTNVVWAFGDVVADICSPLATQDFLYLLESGGYLLCYDVKTGNTVWEHDLANGFSASPSLAGDRLYLLAEDGEMTIIRNDREFKEIAKCELGEKTQATPAFSDGKIYIRGENHLYCIGYKNM